MSEFTCGNLVLNRDVEAIQVFRPTRVKRLNDKWSVFFTKHIESSEKAPQELIEANSDIPVMYFDHAGDHGWTFVIVKSGRIRSAFRLPYEEEYLEMMDLIEEEYPDEDAMDLLNRSANGPEIQDRMLAKLHAKTPPLERAAKWLEPVSLEAFSEFDLTAEQFDSLNALLTPEEFVDDAKMLESVDRFQAIMGITEMSWISPNYPDDEE